ncbi:hypothetical protein C8Q74DRAFT_1216820 [Fomes fomentarius]|nr:hypothetical protein C8Q74DRAFT_1216820 [Fomes fomentarius]
MFARAPIPALALALWLWLFDLTTGSPVPQESSQPATLAVLQVTLHIILGAAPRPASCDGTSRASSSLSCRTTNQAAPFIAAWFHKFSLEAILMAFETSNFKFDVNIFPSGLAKAPEDMMTFPFILKYRTKGRIAEIDLTLSPNVNLSAEQASTVSPDTMKKVRTLILSDELSFTSAAWLLRTRCEPEIADGLKHASAAAWSV